MTLESKLRTLVAKVKAARNGYNFMGYSGNEAAQQVADDIEALLAERQEPPTTREIECKVILRLMGNEPYLGRGHVEGSEFRWTVVADRISVEALAAAPSSGTEGTK